MQGQGPESEARKGPDRGQGQALPGIGRAAPIPDRAHLGDAAADVGQGDAPRQGTVVLPEHQEGIGLAEVDVAGIGRQSPAPGGAGEIVLRPGGLPGLKETAGGLAQVAPFREVGRSRGTNLDPLAL